MGSGEHGTSPSGEESSLSYGSFASFLLLLDAEIAVCKARLYFKAISKVPGCPQCFRKEVTEEMVK